MKADLKSLTGLRGLAACWVMCGHFLNDVPLPGLLRRTIDHGYLAVDLFMILSGLVLAMSYGPRFAAGPPAAQFARFLAHRVARIYPLYALTTLICLVLSLADVPVWGDPKTSLPAVIANLTLVQAWGWPNESLNATGWSISTEWFANLLFPVLALTLLQWRLSRSLWILAAACIALISAAMLAGQAGWDDPIMGAVNWYVAPGALLRCTTGFMLGMICWRLRDASLFASLGSGVMMTALMLVFFAMCQSYTLDLPLLLVIGAIVLGLSQERSWLSRLMGAAPIHWLGTISFSIYLWQMPLAAFEPTLASLLAEWGVAPAKIAANLTMMAMIVGVSHWSFRLIERPAQRRLRVIFDAKRLALA